MNRGVIMTPHLVASSEGLRREERLALRITRERVLLQTT
jgi:hypothetical protein